MAWTTAGIALVAASAAARAQTTAVGTVSSVATNNTTVVAGVTAQPDAPTFTPSTTVTANDTVTVGLRGRNTLIDWQSFSVARGQIATFTTGALPIEAPRAVLNRVTSGTATTLAGQLNATDGIQVWVINPAGILIGPGAAINTGGLVLSTLNLADDRAFLTGGATTGADADRYAVRFTGSSANAGIGAAPDAGVTTIAQIATNNGLLALIAPSVALQADLNSGTGATAFALATDVTMTTTIGGPLSLTLNAGTRIGSTVQGTVVGDRVYALLKPEDGYTALLSMPAAVSNASVDARGVVVLAADASSTIALPGGGSDVVQVSAATDPTGTGSVSLGSISFPAAAAPTAGVRAVAGGTLAITGRIAAGDDVALSGGGGITLGADLAAGTGAVTLAGATTLTADAVLSSASGGITLADPVTGPFALTLTASGTKTIGGAIGGTTAATALTGVTSDGGGATAFGTAATGVRTSGAQSYGAVTLAADTRFIGARGTFGTVGSASAAGHALVLDFTTSAALAGVTGVTTLTSGGGGTTTLAADVTTTGAQSYNGDVVLAGDVGLNAGVAAITVTGGLTGAHALTIDTGGVATLGAIGQGAAGNALAALTIGPRGSSVLNAAVTTTGDQSYGNAVRLAGGGIQALTSTAGGIAFDGTLDAAGAGRVASLAAQTLVAFNGPTGGATPFASLTVAATGRTTINANITGGSTGFANPVTVTGTRTVAGGVAFAATVAGPGALTLSGAGAKTAALGLGSGSGVAALGALTSLAGSGALYVTGDIATAGAQSYGAALYLGAQAPHASHTTTLTGTDLSFAAATPSVFGAAGETLALNFTGTTTLTGGALNGFTALVVGPTGGTAGATTRLGGVFTLGGDATFNNAATLASDVTLRSSGGGAITVAGPVDGDGAGGQALTIETAGVTSLAGSVGSRVGRLVTDAPGRTTIAASVGAATQVYNDAVTIDGAATLTAASDLQFNAGLSGGALTLAGAGTKRFAAAGGIVTLGSLGVGGGVLTIAGGGVTTTGTQAYAGPVALAASATLRGSGLSLAAPLAAGGNDLTLGVAAPITVDGALVGGVRNLLVEGAATLLGTLATTGTQSFGGPITVGGATTRIVAGANAVRFGGTVDSLDGTQALAIDTGGMIGFATPVGSIRPLATLVTLGGGAIALDGGGVTTTGAQSYGGRVSLGTDVTLTGSSVGFAGGVAGFAGGRDHDLTLITSGNDAIDGAGLTGIRALGVGGGGTIALRGTVATSGAQTYADPVTLAAATTLSTGGDVAFGATIDGAQPLTIAIGGRVGVAGAVGSAAPLGALDIAAAGGIALGGDVATLGAQSYRSAVTLTAGGTTVRSTGDQAIGFGGSVDGVTAGAQGLATVTNGATVFGGPVGAAVPLAGLATAGPATIATASITTTGDQRFGGLVTLASDTVLTGATPVFAGGLAGAGHDLTLNFAGTTALGGAVTGVRTLTVGSAGTTTLAGSIVTTGGQRYGNAVVLTGPTMLASTGSGAGTADIAFAGTLDGGYGLSVRTDGIVRFGGAVGRGAAGPLTLLATGGAGSTAIDADIVAATQSYGNAVALGGDRTLAAATALLFGNAVSGAGTLTLTGPGARTFGGPVSLGALVDGAGGSLTIGGGGVRTTGDQRYDGDVLLAGATALASTGGGAITANGRIDGAQALTIDTAGTTTIAGAVGSVAPLASLATDAAGTTVLAGGSIVAGTQRYGDAVLLAADTRLSGADTVTFGGTIDGGRILSIASRGLTQIAGRIGGAQALTGLAVRVGAFAAATGNRVGTIAAAVGGGLGYDDAAALTIGTVDGLSGIATGAAATSVTAAGSLTLAAGVRATGVSLAGVGIVQAPASVVDAGSGTILLDGRGGGIVLAGGLTTSSNAAGAVRLVGAGDVVLGNVATGAAGELVLGGPNGAALAGNVTQAAGTTVAIGTLTGGAGGVIRLTNAGNALATLGAMAANGIAVRDGSAGLTVAGPIDAGTGDLALTLDAGTLGLAGTLRATGGVVTLTGGGPIIQNGGSIVAGTLTGSATGGASFRSAGNQIGVLAGFTNGGSGGFALVDGGALTVGGDIRTAGDLSLTAAGIAAGGRTLDASGAIALAGGSGAVAAGTLIAGTSITLAGGDLSVESARAGGDVSLDAGGIATLGTIAAGSTAALTVRAADVAITGAQTAARATFVNRRAGAATLRVGDGTKADGFRLSQDELGQIRVGTLVLDGGSGDVEIGRWAIAPGAGAQAISVLATGRIDVGGAVSGGGTSRTVRLGGSAASDTDMAAAIVVAAGADGSGGRLALDGADLDLRGTRIGVGQTAGFLTPLGLLGGTPAPVATVAAAYVANANSALYNAAMGGTPYAANAPVLVQARSLTVRYGDYALFQNSGAAGTSAGAVLSDAGAASSPALVLRAAGGGGNAFALFGTINGAGGSAAALLGQRVITLDGADLINTRVNGCLVGSGAGCLSSTVAQPALNIFDASRLNVFRSADDLALPFDPVVGSNNEALFSGLDMSDIPLAPPTCAEASDPACRTVAPAPPTPFAPPAPARATPTPATGAHRETTP